MSWKHLAAEALVSQEAHDKKAAENRIIARQKLLASFLHLPDWQQITFTEIKDTYPVEFKTQMDGYWWLFHGDEPDRWYHTHKTYKPGEVENIYCLSISSHGISWQPVYNLAMVGEYIKQYPWTGGAKLEEPEEPEEPVTLPPGDYPEEDRMMLEFITSTVTDAEPDQDKTSFLRRTSRRWRD